MIYAQHCSTNQYQLLSLKLLAIVETDDFSDLFSHLALVNNSSLLPDPNPSFTTGLQRPCVVPEFRSTSNVKYPCPPICYSFEVFK